MGASKSTLFFLFLTIVVLSVTHIYIEISRPLLIESESTLIEIPQGITIDKVAVLLQQKKIIKSRRLFCLLARLQPKKLIKAGEYHISPAISMLQLLNTLYEGKIFCRKITIPEGYTVRQIAKLLVKKGIIADQDRFIRLAHNKNIIKDLGFEAPSLEGYLYPDTYYFSKGLREESILKVMVSRFHDIFLPEWKDRSRELGVTFQEMITLASLIEKETSNEGERHLISAVYHNRLKAGIRLQCDPTVIYSLKDFNGNLTREHLLNDSPYNTYQKYGLPPGPIANPGRESIEAALYPADVKYRYFVSKNDGTHKFSYSLRDHNRAVFKYQKRR